jgi:osmoprotectant transport system ATP-binding protein
MITLEHVRKLFGTVVAVDDLSLQIDQGEVCVLIGPSGCGKTTTLRMINRLLDPTEGKILFDGIDIRRLRPEHLRRSIGYAIQNIGLFPHLTVAANIAIVPELLKWKKEKIKHRVEELLALVGLDPDKYSRKYINQLSGGESQRIGVARSLAADPPVLLMDEPFGAVDPLTRQKLQTQFQHIQKGLRKTVILVTHDLDEAIRLADKLAIMQSGKLIQYDSPDVILSRPVSKFVHDFVGVDRALKRLSRLETENFMKPAPTVELRTSKEEIMAAIGNRPSIWVVDDEKRLIGWIDKASLFSSTSINELVVRGNIDEITITSSDTLHMALSKMLGLGFKSLPVIDNDGKFNGEIELIDIENATAPYEVAKHATE